MLPIRQKKPPKAVYAMKVNARRTRVTSKPPWMMGRPIEDDEKTNILA
jgi:hypothetical protein